MAASTERGTGALDNLMGSAKLAEPTRKDSLWRVEKYLEHSGETPDELVAHARAQPRKFEESFKGFFVGRKERSGPSNLTGVDASRLDWIIYSQNDPRIINAFW